MGVTIRYIDPSAERTAKGVRGVRVQHPGRLSKAILVDLLPQENDVPERGVQRLVLSVQLPAEVLYLGLKFFIGQRALLVRHCPSPISHSRSPPTRHR